MIALSLSTPSQIFFCSGAQMVPGMRGSILLLGSITRSCSCIYIKLSNHLKRFVRGGLQEIPPPRKENRHLRSGS